MIIFILAILKKLASHFLDKEKHMPNNKNLQLHSRPGLNIKCTLCMVAEILEKSKILLFYIHVI